MAEGPYGPLIETRLRLVTWNVWGRFGPWQRRQPGIAAVLADCRPDVVTFQEAWSAPDRDQAAEVAAAVGLPYHHYAYDRDDEDGASSGTSVLSRWPITATEVRPLLRARTRNGSVLRADLAGPRGPLRVFSVGLDWPPHYSHVRQEQVRELVAYAWPVMSAVIAAAQARPASES